MHAKMSDNQPKSLTHFGELMRFVAENSIAFLLKNI